MPKIHRRRKVKKVTKKAVENKPVENKPEGKKVIKRNPAGKKAVVKKVIKKNPVENKPAGKKAVENKPIEKKAEEKCEVSHEEGGYCVICQQQENTQKFTKNGAIMKGYVLVNEERDTWKVIREEWVSFCSSSEHVSKSRNHLPCDKQMDCVGYLDKNEVQWDFE